MTKARFLVWLLLFALILSSCSIDLDQPAIATPDADIPSPTSPPEISAVNTAPAIPTTIPVTWSGLNLTGSLVYISPLVTGDVAYFISIRKLNLLTGEITPIFRTTGDDWIFYLTVSPDASQLIMSYLPPSQGIAAPSRA